MFSGDFEKARERYKQALKVVKDAQTETSIKTFITISSLFQRNFEGALDNLYSKLHSSLNGLLHQKLDLLHRNHILSLSFLTSFKD